MPYHVVPSNLVELLRDPIQLCAVLFCADVPPEAALTLGNDLFDLFVKFHDVPKHLDLSEAWKR